MKEKEKINCTEGMEEEIAMQGIPGIDKVAAFIEILRQLSLEEIKHLRSALWLVGGEDIHSPDYQADRPIFENKYFFYKIDGEYRKVDIDTIIYIEAKDNYVSLHYPSGKPIVFRTTLEGISRELPVHEFFRISRTHIIAMKYLTAFNKEYVRLGEFQFAVSKKYYPVLEWRVELMRTY